MTAHVEFASIPFVPLDTRGSESQVIFASGLGLTATEPSLEQVCDLLMALPESEIAFPSSLVWREDFYEILGLLQELKKTARLVVQVGYDLAQLQERVKGYESHLDLDLLFDRRQADWSFLLATAAFRSVRLVLIASPLFDWESALDSVPDEYRSNLKMSFLQNDLGLSSLFSADEIILQTHRAQRVYSMQGRDFQPLTYSPRTVIQGALGHLDFYEEPSVANYRKDILLMGAFSYYGRWILQQSSYWFRTLPKRIYRGVFVFLLRCREFYMGVPHRSFHTAKPIAASYYWRGRHILITSGQRTYWLIRSSLWRAFNLLFWKGRAFAQMAYYGLRHQAQRIYFALKGPALKPYHFLMYQWKKRVRPQ